MSSSLSPKTAIAACLAIGALLLPAAPSQADVAVSCAIVEAGALGPPGNVLRIEDGTNSVTHIYREGVEIVVFNNAASDPTACSGGAPTVFSVDRIEYESSNGVPFIGYLGAGALAPGATLEASGSEIEIVVREGYPGEVLNVGDTAGPDVIVAGALGQHRIGVNLNSQADGPNQDADVVLDAVDPARAVVKVIGRGGSDMLSATGGPGFAGPLLVDRLLLAGGPGDDLLAGTPGKDSLAGGDGDDVMHGGRGRDRIALGPGRDLARAGKGADTIENHSDVGGILPDLGPDKVFAGAGNDRVNLERSPRGNLLNCGTGRRDLAIVNHDDRVANCEQVEVTPR